MEKNHPLDHYRLTVLPALVSKCEEFQMFGYKDVTVEKLWTFMQEKKWRKVKEDLRLHQLVNDILTVKVSDYLHYMTLESFKEAQENSSPDFDDFKDLFV
ncbi:MAG: post-transcriptional regulator [Bacillus sp. (in: firmicutes)]